MELILNMSSLKKYLCLFFRSQNKYQENPDSYNGAVRENYSWSQDYSDVEVRVFVPKTVIKGRQVKVHLICWEGSFSPHSVEFSISHLSPVCPSGHCQSAGQQRQSVCEGRSGGENTDGGWTDQ